MTIAGCSRSSWIDTTNPNKTPRCRNVWSEWPIYCLVSHAFRVCSTATTADDAQTVTGKWRETPFDYDDGMAELIRLSPFLCKLNKTIKTATAADSRYERLIAGFPLKHRQIGGKYKYNKRSWSWVDENLCIIRRSLTIHYNEIALKKINVILGRGHKTNDDVILLNRAIIAKNILIVLV